MHRALQLPEVTLPGYPSTHALYSHFSGVERLDEIEQTLEVPPYPVDDAAVHHVFDGGWIWVLRFNNGIISAGIAATEEVEKKLRFDDGAVAWERLLELVPTLKRQFIAVDGSAAIYTRAAALIPEQRGLWRSLGTASIGGGGLSILCSRRDFRSRFWASAGWPTCLSMTGIRRASQ